MTSAPKLMSALPFLGSLKLSGNKSLSCPESLENLCEKINYIFTSFLIFALNKTSLHHYYFTVHNQGNFQKS